MAALGVVVTVVFNVAVGAVLLGISLFLLTARPAQKTARVVGATFAAAAALPLLVAASLLATDPITRTALGRMSEDFLLASILGTLLVLALHPRPARGWERVFFAAALAFLVVQLVAWFGFRSWVVAPGDARFRATLQWQLLGPYSLAVALLVDVAFLLAYRRALALPARERRGAAIVLSTLILATWFAPGVPFALLASGTTPGIFGDIAGDCCRIAPTLWVLAYAFLPLGMAAYLAWRHRDRLPLAYLGLGLVIALLGSFGNVNLAPAGAILSGGALLYAIARYGALGIREPPRQVAIGLALLMGVGAFLIVHATVIGFDPTNSLLLTGGLLAGGTVGVAAAAVSFPNAVSLLDALRGNEAAATTRGRLEPYRVVLDQELSSGAPPQAIREKLRPLRASLGVSDQEHAVLEYVATTGNAPMLGATQVVPGKRFLDRYRVMATLREGGAGVTHLCHDERVGRDVVVKTLRSTADPEALDALMAEARALARVAHPNVVTLLDADRVGDEAFLVMEHVEGGSLADRLAREPLPREAFAAFADDLLGGLAAVHAAGLAHRDVKPGNVLLTREGRAKLADFGIAHIPGFETTAAVAVDARVLGTIRYMSPEQARGRPVGARSDLYSAALVLYEAWMGKPYFDARPAESAVELQMRVASAAGWDAAWEGPPALRDVLAKALSPAPSERYAHADEMRAALRDAR